MPLVRKLIALPTKFSYKSYMRLCEFKILNIFRFVFSVHMISHSLHMQLTAKIWMLVPELNIFMYYFHNLPV